MICARRLVIVACLADSSLLIRSAFDAFPVFTRLVYVTSNVKLTGPLNSHLHWPIDILRYALLVVQLVPRRQINLPQAANNLVTWSMFNGGHAAVPTCTLPTENEPIIAQRGIGDEPGRGRVDMNALITVCLIICGKKN